MDLDERQAAVPRILTSPWLIGGIALVLLAVRVVGAGIGRDSGVWTYVGWLWREYGLPPYTGAVDNKTPGIHMLYALSIRYFGLTIWPHAVLGGAAVLGAGSLLYAMAARLCNRFAGAVTMVLFCFAMAWHSLNGPLFVEPFMVFFAVLAFALVVFSADSASPRTRALGALLAGMAGGFAVGFKQTALLDGLALLVLFILLARRRSDGPGRIASGAGLIIAGAAIATGLTIVPLLLSGGSLADYWDGAWLTLLRGSGASAARRLYEFVRAWGASKMMLFYPLIVLFVAQRKRLCAWGVPVAGLMSWLVLEFMAANASGCMWGHQIQGVLPTFALTGGIAAAGVLDLVGGRDQAARRRLARLLLVLFAFMWLPYEVVVKKADLFYFERPEDQTRPMAAWVRENVPVDEYVYAYDRSAGTVLALAGRRSPSRHFHNHFMESPVIAGEVQRDLAERPPAVVLIANDTLPTPPQWLYEMIEREYSSLGEMYDYQVFERSGPGSP